MSGILGDSDITAMLEDLAEADGAVEVRFGSASVQGLFDRASAELFAGEMPTLVGDAEVVHVKAGSLPGLGPGSTVTVDGTSYKVQKLLVHGDGAMQAIVLTTP